MILKIECVTEDVKVLFELLNINCFFTCPP